MIRCRTLTRRLCLALVAVGASTASALEPPTAEQIERYRRDGSLAARAEAARAIGNHRMAPELAARLGGGAEVKARPAEPKVLPADGAPEVLTLLVAFDDMPGHTDPAVVRDRVLGDGEPWGYPYESLTAFYRRSSYGRLEIGGEVLGWYTTPYPRDSVVETYIGRQNLIKEVISHYDAEGHDFSRYDNDGDGVIDYLAVIWTGPHGEWAEFWWGYQTIFWNDPFTVDGVALGTYSWQWESYDWPGEFTPNTLIHETGHALGLPDYYDYDDAVGPDGGLGGMDQMDGNWGDHNAFSKWVLGWLDPAVYNQDSHELLVAPSDSEPDALVVMHGDPMTDPYGEYFMVQHRRRIGNDTELPTDGLLIWHVDARLADDGSFLYDNSYTDHKLIRLMEADGLEEIEQGARADAGDFYTPGDLFDSATVPSSHRYDGVPTNIAIHTITEAGLRYGLQADLGSGCALWCSASVSPTAWPGIPIAFSGSLDAANCDGAPFYGWVFGDGAASGETSASHSYVSTGAYNWNVTATLEDATCLHQGTIEVCTGFECWQWLPGTAMAQPPSFHTAAALSDGRVLVLAGDPDRAALYDPVADAWAPAARPPASFGASRAVSLDDGRVLAVGAILEGPAPQVNTALYAPGSDSWHSPGQLEHNRIGHSLVKLNDGRVLLVGGVYRDGPDYVDATALEVFDPVFGTWAEVGDVGRQLFDPGLARLSDGRVLIVGGRELTLVDPTTWDLTRAAPLPDEWHDPLAVSLHDGRVLLANPAGGTTTLLWRPLDGGWELGGDLGATRRDHTATLLPNGRVLLTGGRTGPTSEFIETTEFFDPESAQWRGASSLTVPRGYHTATLTANGTLVVVGGVSPTGSATTTATGSVELLTKPSSPPRHLSGRRSP